jgi:hypothetical protein
LRERETDMIEKKEKRKRERSEFWKEMDIMKTCVKGLKKGLGSRIEN